MIKKEFNRNPKGNNQWELRTDEELQKIIDSKPSNWTKKDFRGEGKNNKTKILTRKETERENLVFKNKVHRKRFENNKLQCSICRIFKPLDEFPNDAHGWKNKKRSNCSECDSDRNFNFLNNMSNNKRKKFYKNIYENLTQEQLEAKRDRQKKWYYEQKDNN